MCRLRMTLRCIAAGQRRAVIVREVPPDGSLRCGVAIEIADDPLKPRPGAPAAPRQCERMPGEKTSLSLALSLDDLRSRRVRASAAILDHRARLGRVRYPDRGV